MKPFKKIIQLVYRGDGYRMIALCEDGSIWWFDESDGSFEMITEMDGGRYT